MYLSFLTRDTHTHTPFCYGNRFCCQHFLNACRTARIHFFKLILAYFHILRCSALHSYARGLYESLKGFCPRVLSPAFHDLKKQSLGRVGVWVAWDAQGSCLAERLEEVPDVLLCLPVLESFEPAPSL